MDAAIRHGFSVKQALVQAGNCVLSSVQVTFALHARCAVLGYMLCAAAGIRKLHAATSGDVLRLGPQANITQ
jgi:hypothetical protein